MATRPPWPGATGRRRVVVRLVIAMGVAQLAACGIGTPAVTVSDPRIPAPAGPNGALYMTLTNHGDGDARLTGVRTDVAADTELHRSTLDDGMLSMRRIDSIDLPAGSQVTLEPGGTHVMLIDVGTKLTDGDTVELTLMFDRAEPQRVRARVVPLGGEG